MTNDINEMRDPPFNLKILNHPVIIMAFAAPAAIVLGGAFLIKTLRTAIRNKKES